LVGTGVSDTVAGAVVRDPSDAGCEGAAVSVIAGVASSSGLVAFGVCGVCAGAVSVVSAVVGAMVSAAVGAPVTASDAVGRALASPPPNMPEAIPKQL